MSWIKTVAYEEAKGRLKTLYDRVKGPDDNVDNIMMAHSLRPHTMEGHMALYKYVLHHSSNTLPKWFLETIGVWVSALNACDYCVEHHFAGLKRLLKDDEKSTAIRKAIDERDFINGPLTKSEVLALRYARTLTLTPDAITAKDIDALRDAGSHDRAHADQSADLRLCESEGDQCRCATELPGKG